MLNAALAVWSYLGQPLAPATLATFLLLIAALAYMSWVIVYSGINKPNRIIINNLSMSEKPLVEKLFTKLYDLMQCPFCTGFWLTSAVMLVLKPDFFHAGPVGVLLGIPAIAGLQALLALGMALAIKHNPCDSCITDSDPPPE